MLLARPAYRALVRVVALADASYKLKDPSGRPASPPLLIGYAVEALDGSRLFIATASATPNNSQGVEEPSGAPTLVRLASDIEARSEQRFDLGSAIEGVDQLRPARVWHRGSVLLADFGSQFTHAEHATKLAPVLWPDVVQPWVDRGVIANEPTLDDEPTTRGEHAAQGESEFSLAKGLTLAAFVSGSVALGRLIFGSRLQSTRAVGAPSGSSPQGK